MKTKLITAIALAMGVGAGSAVAAPINLPDGPVYFQFNNLEQVDTSLGNNIAVPGGAIDVTGDGIADTPATEGNWGVVNLSSIQAGAVATSHQDISGGPGVWFDDGPSGFANQGQVSGIFYGVTTTSGTTATGGWLDIYWEDDGADDIAAADLNGTGFVPGNRTAANQAGIFTDGTLLARLAFAPGIISGDATTFTQSDIDVSNITGNGKADSFADVVDINNDGVIDGLDGVWASDLDQDWFWVDVDGDGVFGEAGEKRDLRFSRFFNLLGAWDDGNNPNILGLRSNDPGRAYVSVPEPASMALISLGLLGAGFAARRRRNV